MVKAKAGRGKQANVLSKKMIVGNLEVTVIKKNIKNMYLRVLPPDGAVQITAPRQMSDDGIEAFARSRLSWIDEQKKKIAQRLDLPPLCYETGETVFYQGKKYCLEVCGESGKPERAAKSASHVEIKNETLFFYVPRDSTIQQREQMLDDWYRQRLEERIPSVASRCEQITGVSAREWRIRKMKTRWGSCNPSKARIWLNLKLIQLPPECLEYVITHELIHLMEPSHNKRFYALMDRFYPNWRAVRRMMREGNTGNTEEKS